VEALGDIAQYAGPLALACFGGTLLGGIALSFFWKNFGPWKLLEACREECRRCEEHRTADAAERSRLMAHLADLNARHTIMLQAMERGGLGLQLGPNIGIEMPVTLVVPKPPSDSPSPFPYSPTNPKPGEV